jgi:hypothetical protein
MIRVYHDSREEQDGTPPIPEELILVADVYTDDPHEAVGLTRHPMGGTWRNNPKVNPIGGVTRSTEHGDVLERNGNFSHFWYYKKADKVKHDMFVGLDKKYYKELLSQAPGTNLEPRPPVTSGCGFGFDY